MREQLKRAGLPGPKVIGIDEISIRKGHTYRIMVSDLLRQRPICFGGKGSMIVTLRQDINGGNPMADPRDTQRQLERIFLNRLSQPECLIGSVVFLASDASNLVNGHILYVDGGYAVSG
jgi:hypothetical protein